MHKCNNRPMSETKSPRLFLRIGAAAAVTSLALGVPSLLGSVGTVSVRTEPVANRVPAQPVVPVVQVTPPPSTTTTTVPTPPPPPPPTSGELAIFWALKTLGTPYRYGGSTPSGFDCSGLVMWAYAQAGVRVPRTASEQRSASTSISQAELQVGDLVFYYGTGHVGMYMGYGQILHSPRTGKSVEIVPLNRGGMSASSFGRINRIK